MKKVLLIAFFIQSINSFSQQIFVGEECKFTFIMPGGWNLLQKNNTDDKYFYSFSNPLGELFTIFVNLNSNNNFQNSLENCKLTEREKYTLATSDPTSKLNKVISDGCYIVDNIFAYYVEYENSKGTNFTCVIHRPNDYSIEYTLNTCLNGKKGSSLNNIQDMLRNSFKFY